jgi:leucyl-tRNA synthetase
MKENCDGYRGLKVNEAKPQIIEAMKARGWLAVMQELPQRVVCKCGTRCYVKILENQWFLNYGDPEWKERTKSLIRKASVYPEQSLEWYFSTIDWLHNWPCARRSGMGTKLPWDKEWIVETLSDSTIYMAFYTINQLVNAEKVKFEQLVPEVFDYVFLGKGSEAHVAKLSGIDLKLLSNMRNEFLYWYPVDLRNSAKELIPNHLTFFAFHHAALFPEKFWPKGFGINGMIQIEGKKMSKTKGNFVTWRAALEKYGADGFRLALALTADGMDDADWRERAAEDSKGKVEAIIPFVKKTLKSAVIRDENELDHWLVSSVHRRIITATEAMEEMKIRRASATAFLDIWNDVRYYLHRTKRPRKQTLVDVYTAWVRMMSPVTPFMAEDLNHELGGKGLVCQADWPSPKDFPLDEGAELAEAVLNKVIDDARNVMKVVKGPKSKLNVYVCSDSARSYFLELANAKRKNENVGLVIKKFASLKIQPDRVFRLTFELGDDMITKLLSQKGFDEYKALSEAAEFMSSELGIKVSVQKAGAKDITDPANKAKDALPTKPGFFLE